MLKSPRSLFLSHSLETIPSNPLVLPKVILFILKEVMKTPSWEFQLLLLLFLFMVFTLTKYLMFSEYFRDRENLKPKLLSDTQSLLL